MSEKIGGARLDRIADWLRERTRATCPFCQGREWTVHDELGAIPSLQHADPHLQLDRGHTLVLVTCEHCGFTAPFAAKKIQVE